ncbi:MAG: CPBP family intramembrane glutamic endopeptidase [Myxococcaceae bacterium]
MAGTLLSPRFWPWRLGMAMGLPWLFRFLLDRWLAMGLSGAFFGISHATNAGATPLGIAAIALGGVFLAACYLRYGSLWVPIAFHFAWDTTMGVVLGLPVSGTPLPGLLHMQMTGPEPWTGGGFGPEASTALQPFIFAAAAFYLWKVVVERKLTPPPWRARPVPAAPAVPAPASIPSTRGPAA